MPSRVPTPAEIAAELAALKELRALIPPRTLFGDDNLDAISAEIDVLEHRLTDRQIAAIYGGDETAEEYDGLTPAEESADYAYQWMHGAALDGAMSEGWVSTLSETARQQWAARHARPS